MDAVDRLVDSLLSATATASPFAIGTIATVDTGTTPATVTVDWNGSIVPAQFPRGLSSPTVGHTVLMARTGRDGSQLLILHTY